MSGFNISELMGVFLDEVDEQLQFLEESILQLEQDSEDNEVIQTLFRIAHTLKGSSAAMGFEEMKQLTHEMENVLEKIRSHALAVDKHLINLLFKSLDQLRLLKEEFKENKETRTNIDSLVEELQGVMAGKSKDKIEKKEINSKLDLSLEQYLQLTEAEGKGLHSWFCEVELDAQCEMKSVRAFIILKALEELGSVITTSPNLDEISENQDLSDKFTYLVTTNLDSATLQDNLEKNIDVQAVKVSPFSEEKIHNHHQLLKQTKRQNQIKEPEKEARTSQTIRVDVERLEKLMNLVGELVIDQTRIAQLGSILHSRHPSDETVEDLVQVSGHVSQVIGELQESVMKTRMLPIQQVFNRFPRMIRDLSQSLQKEIDVHIEGGETELDRTVIEEITDPLIHLIRNAIDHGIEDSAVRQKAGKPPVGSISINAYHQENHVVLTIEDDGAGIDPEKIKQSALAKQIITEQDAKNMGEQETINLIFSPGFSTAQTISDVSGRGVGMDIVRSHIEKLNGLIDVETVLGQGTKFIVKLPLTLAILMGLLVKLNGRTYVLPMSSVIEIVRISEKEIGSVNGQAVAVIREKVLPLIWLHDHFDIPRSSKKGEHVRIVVVGVAEKRLGIVVDELVGNQEIVIKSMGSYIGKIMGVSGATILGDGSVAMILDIIGVNKLVNNH